LASLIFLRQRQVRPESSSQSEHILNDAGIAGEVEGPMIENDTYKFQRERIIGVVAEKAPGKEVQFDERSWIKFRVVEPAAPSISLTEPTGEWIPSEFGDKFPTDDALWNFIQRLSNGKL
jgi:hypothetical protein